MEPPSASLPTVMSENQVKEPKITRSLTDEQPTNPIQLPTIVRAKEPNGSPRPTTLGEMDSSVTQFNSHVFSLN